MHYVSSRYYQDSFGVRDIFTLNKNKTFTIFSAKQVK